MRMILGGFGRRRLRGSSMVGEIRLVKAPVIPISKVNLCPGE